MKHIIKSLVVLAAVAALAGCSKEFINKDKPLSMTEPLIFADADYIESALLGCYDVFKSSNPTFMGGLGMIVFDSRGDDIVNVSNPVTMSDTYEMNVLGTSDENGRIWNYAYGTINTCNIFLENLEKYECEKVLGAALYKQYAAEAKFLRAYSYYVLANLYSEPYCKNQNALCVPLRTTALVSAGNNDCPAAPIKDIYEQILNDCVPADLPNGVGKRDGVTRASKAAAQLLRMRVYMAEEEWTKAIAEGTAISGYSLVSDVTKLYGTDIYDNTEMIFAMPASTIFFGSVPCTTMTTGAAFSANADEGAAQKLPTAAAVPVLRKVRRLIRAVGTAAFCTVVFMESSSCCEKNASLPHCTVAKRSTSFSMVTGFKSIASKPRSR